MINTAPYSEQWHLLGIYNIYRIGIVFVVAVLFAFGILPQYFHTVPYFFILIVYFFFALGFIGLYIQRKPRFDHQVLITGIVDLIIMSIFINSLEKVQAGMIILLNVNVAILSILVPGRMAIFYAAIGTCMLLALSGLEIVQYHTSPDNLYKAGVHGVGLFATAIVAWYLANWIRISEEVRARQASELAEMEKINAYIVARLHAGVVYCDQQEKVKLINQSAKRLFRLSEHKTVTELADLSPTLSKKFKIFIEKLHENKLAGQANLSDFMLKVHFYPATTHQEGGIFIFIDDISAATQTAQQLKLAALGRLTASIAHELRNPLGAIAHAVQILGEEGELTPADKRLQVLIANNSDRMNQIIKNILQLSRREHSRPQALPLVEFVNTFIENFQASHACQMDFQSRINDAPVISFDSSQLEQVLVILCENVLMHGRNSSEKAIIHFVLDKLSENFQLSIVDEGPGIKPENQQKIYEPFFSSLREGTGMGLFIARDLCEINQASLASLPSSEGACFIISFSYSGEINL